jgi:hypothetical protein
MIVRAYFLLTDAAGGQPALVPVLRTVPKSSATATAALKALLAGPSAKELAASPRITTSIPDGTRFLDVDIANGLATVDLSSDYASGGGAFSMRTRLAQVVYTLTQFSTVTRVQFKLDGQPVTTFSSEGIVLDKPLTRSSDRDEVLPPIFVDRPAWGAGFLTPGTVTGVANVFEAQFRITLLAHDGSVLDDTSVIATCGSGCWGRFEASLTYKVSAAQWGTLRAWDVSEGSGLVEAVREYPVYLRPAP